MYDPTGNAWRNRLFLLAENGRPPESNVGYESHYGEQGYDGLG